jgi:hypothetical protein
LSAKDEIEEASRKLVKAWYRKDLFGLGALLSPGDYAGSRWLQPLVLTFHPGFLLVSPECTIIFAAAQKDVGITEVNVEPKNWLGGKTPSGLTLYWHREGGRWRCWLTEHRECWNPDPVLRKDYERFVKAAASYRCLPEDGEKARIHTLQLLEALRAGDPTACGKYISSHLFYHNLRSSWSRGDYEREVGTLLAREYSHVKVTLSVLEPACDGIDWEEAPPRAETQEALRKGPQMVELRGWRVRVEGEGPRRLSTDFCWVMEDGQLKLWSWR